MQNIIFIVLSCILVLLAANIALAADPLAQSGLQQRLVWQTRWGDIDFNGNEDTIIPAANHQAKGDIKRIVKTCGTQSSDLSSLGVYAADLTSDGKLDYIIDGNGYFPKYYKNGCPVSICTDDEGCYVSIYITGENTNIIAEKSTDEEDSCPKTAQKNDACLSYCAAAEDLCPGNFKYNMKTVFNQRVKTWNVLPVLSFQNFITGLKTYRLLNNKPVLAAQMKNTNCYQDEIAANNNRCIKYYQFDNDKGVFVDLYVFEDFANGEFDTRFTYTPFDRDAAHLARGLVQSGGFAHRLAKGSSIDEQVADFTHTDADGKVLAKGFQSFHIENHSDKDFFVPANTDKEFCSFLNHPPKGVVIGKTSLRFTDWVGDLVCPKNIFRGQSINIVAQRYCQRSTSAYAPCQECIDAKVPGYEMGCTYRQVCQGDTCMFNEGVADMFIPWARPFNGKLTTQAACEAREPGLWEGLWTHGKVAWYGGCGGAFDELCQQGIFCLSGDTKIALPGGAEKELKNIKAGDTVLGFVYPSKKAQPTKVARVMITEKQPIIVINKKLKLTPNHYVVNNKGLKIRADKINAGDKLSGIDGNIITVDAIEPSEEKITVYNLELENNAGFIADGVLVMGWSK